jgi:predicted PurR-regulated permease PerM
MKIDYSALPVWLQSVLVFGAIAVAVVAIIALFVKVWGMVTVFVETVKSLNDLPQFMVTTAATLEAQDVKIEEIHHEVKYNNGSSVKDAVRRVEIGVKGIYGRLDSADKDRSDLRHDLEQTRPKPIRTRTTKPKETP